MRVLIWLFAFVVAVVTFAAVAGAAQVDESALDRHTRAIAQELRCLVCQGETVADSHASLAVDMRAEIRDKLKQGWSERRILDYFVARYGDFVLYRPPFQPTTWFLWLAPLAVVVFGIVFLLAHVRRRVQRAAAAPLAPLEAKRAHELLQRPEEMPR